MLRWTKPLIAITLGCMIAFFIGEGIVRLKGHQPYSVHSPQLVIEPDNYGVLHNSLGYALTPGEFELTLKEKLRSTSTHGLDSFRITRNEPDSFYTDSERIHLYGCSFTYGQHLDDSMTFPWKLQEQLTYYNVKNYGVGGYGLSQALILLKKHIANEVPPKIAIVNYASFHKDRHTLVRRQMKIMAPYYAPDQKWVYPSFQKSGDTLALNYKEVHYQAWPFMRNSALIHFFEQYYNYFQGEKEDGEEVSWRLLVKINEICQQHGIQLLITGIYDDDMTRNMLHKCEKEGMATLDISTDPGIQENTLSPYDSHPSSKSNDIYAEKILAFLVSHNWIHKK